MRRKSVSARNKYTLSSTRLTRNPSQHDSHTFSTVRDIKKPKPIRLIAGHAHTSRCKRRAQHTLSMSRPPNGERRRRRLARSARTHHDEPNPHKSTSCTSRSQLGNNPHETKTNIENPIQNGRRSSIHTRIQRQHQWWWFLWRRRIGGNGSIGLCLLGNYKAIIMRRQINVCSLENCESLTIDYITRTML